MVCGQTCDGLYHFTFCLIIFGIPIGSHTIRPALARHTGVRRVYGSRHGDHVINFSQSASLFSLSFKPMPINIGTYNIQPYRCTWVVLWLFCFRSTPQRSLIYGPLSRVLFGESLVNRLYSEIDQIHLSIEAQCVSPYYPLWTATQLFFIMFLKLFGLSTETVASSNEFHGSTTLFEKKFLATSSLLLLLNIF